MQQLTKDAYVEKFGENMWQEKVAKINEGREVDFVYATNNGNIFMIILAEE